MAKTGVVPLSPLAIVFLILGLGAFFVFETVYTINLARDFGHVLCIWGWSRLGLQGRSTPGVSVFGKGLSYWVPRHELHNAYSVGRGVKCSPRPSNSRDVLSSRNLFREEMLNTMRWQFPWPLRSLEDFCTICSSTLGPRSPIDTPWLGLRRLTQPWNPARRKEGSVISGSRSQSGSSTVIYPCRQVRKAMIGLGICTCFADRTW